MFAKTPKIDFAKLLTVNSTDGSCVFGSPTTTAPTAGVITPWQLNAPSTLPSLERYDQHDNIVFSVFGVGADNADGTFVLQGWRLCGTLWVPIQLLAGTWTLGGSVGVAGAVVADTERFADTLAITGAYTSAYEIISPANEGIAAIKVDVFGCGLVQLAFGKGTATSVNALYAAF
jgi:hypothetical protein